MSGRRITPEQLLIELSQREGPFDWAELYGNDHPVELEIGIGKGRFIREQARRRPETNFFAIERARKYARIALNRAARDGLANFRLFIGDAPDLLERFLPDSSLAALYVFYSDPWPKKRHHKRRLFQPETVALFARKLIPGASLIVKSDVTAYFEEIAAMIAAQSELELLECGSVSPERFEPALRTNFEVKTVQRGALVHYLEARKAPTEGLGESSRKTS